MTGVSEEHLTINASLSGWGAVWNQQTAQGLWAAEEAILPVNLLELWAIRLALLHFTTALWGRHVLIRTDVVAKAHIKQGGSRSSQLLHKETLLLFTLVEEHLEGIRAEHVRGLDNTQTDWLSREVVSPGEWSLHPTSSPYS